MPSLLSETYVCDDCGKQYANEWHLGSHLRDCAPSKRSLSDLLSQTKEFWESRKRRRLDLQELEQDRTPSPAHLPDIVQADDPSIHEPIATRRQGRPARLPARYRQSATPEPTHPRREAPANPCSGNTSSPCEPRNIPAQGAPSNDAASIPTVSTSKRDRFGVMKTFSLFEPSDSTDHQRESLVPAQSQNESSSSYPYGPFPNKTSFALADWYWNSNNKSNRDFRNLIGIIKHPDFSAEDAGSANWNSIFKELGANKQDLPEDKGSWITDDGWRTAPVYIDIPFHNHLKGKGTEAYHAGQLHYRSIVSVIREHLVDPSKASRMQFHPYRATWKPTDDYPDIQLYGEMYISPEFQRAYEDVQRLPQTEQNSGLERVVVGLMFASDATHLTDFGTACLWPCYMSFGNESKYRRCRPSERANHHIAYFEFLSDSILDNLHRRNNGRLPSETAETILKYCQREVFHRQWSLLLDEELMDAMANGLVVICSDGKRRCFYPRIMTYSADYPEKCLIACTRRLGSKPCHRCLVQKSKEAQSTLGSPADTERTEMQRDEEQQNASIVAALQDISNGYAINSQVVEQKLFPESLHATKSAFAALLSAFNFSIKSALVVDVLHEFEIGFWKRVLAHLIRLLVAAQGSTSPLNLRDELDRRYRLTPAFGRDTIRKFNTNTSHMARKTARHFEDALQCAIPAFSSLLPEEHNANLLKLLYICAEWHALAKLRMHNDFTLRLLDHTTILLGAQVRAFHQKTCSTFDTRELEKETSARRKKAGKGKVAGGKRIDFDVYTIKFHYLGDYTSTIRQFGTTDSYSTETGELSHCLPKSWYPRTNKQAFRTQMSQIERRQARLAQISQSHESSQAKAEVQDLDSDDCLKPQFIIGTTQNNPFYLVDLLPRRDIRIHQNPFLKDFIPKLKQHLLPRILRKLGFGAEACHIHNWTHVSLQDDRFFQHRLMRINYEMYDTRTGGDIIHVESPQRTVMLLNPRHTAETQTIEHPYRYFDVLGVLHANVSFIGTLPNGSRCYDTHRLEFLWVRQYKVEPSVPFRLDRVKLCSLDTSDALSFLDPLDALRAVHLIPCFEEGTLQEPVTHPWQTGSQAIQLWNTYYINKFVDRDMYMRYQWGMSVGHRYMYPRFPPPSVPTIGPEFDFCLLPRPEGGSAIFGPEQLDAEQLDAEEQDGQGDSDSDHDNDDDDDLDDREVALRKEMYPPCE